jgi:hypothetical protein
LIEILFDKRIFRGHDMDSRAKPIFDTFLLLISQDDTYSLPQ